MKRKKSKFSDEEKIIFPKCNKTVTNRSEESFLKDLEHMKARMEKFLYLDKDEICDIREGYLQFMDDAQEYIKCFEEIVLDIVEAMKYYKGIKEHAVALSKIARQYEARAQKFQDAMLEKGIDPLEPLAMVKQIEQQVSTKAQELIRRKADLDKVEQEIAITAEVLDRKKSEMEKALRTRYTLTESQKQTLVEEKDKILDGVEQWGSVTGALSHDRTIKSKAATIQMYCQVFPEFGKAIEVSKTLFKDKLEAIMIDRALEGTENPVFGKGEHIGDYKIKDNKLFMELVKAKMPEEYNKKSVETNKPTQVNNSLNIISFANVDETKEGFTRDVGVVLDVDNTGKVERITQEKKLVEYYSNKEGAEIITPDKEKEE